MLTPVELINTVWIGSVYFISAAGLTLSYRVTRILNFAYTNMMTLGAYLAVILTLNGTGNLLVLIPIVFVAGSLLAMGMHYFVFSRLISLKATPLMLMASSIGIWIFLKYVYYGIVGYLQRAWKVGLYQATPNLNLDWGLKAYGIEFSGAFVASIALAAAVILLLYLFLTKTRTGKALRAVADNPSLAEVSGIPSDRVMYVTWFIAGGLASLSGLMWALFSIVTPEVGDNLILEIFAVSVIGGLYSIPLTALGAYVISGAENLLMPILHDTIGLEVSFRPFIAFFTLLVVILIKPPLGAAGGLPYRFRLRRKER